MPLQIGRVRTALILCSLLCFAFVTSNAQTVYVTKSGKKYHSKGCTSLRVSSIPLDLSEAIGRYSPCKNCNPPTFGASQTGVRGEQKTQSRTASDGRCEAMTKKGARCSRKAQSGSRYCWQHNK